MKQTIIGIIIGLALGGGVTWTLLNRHEHGEEKKAEHKEESRVQHGTNGETFLKLDKEAHEHAGLKTAALAAVTLAPEAKGYGRVLDPAPLATVMVEIATARATLDASLKDHQRLKTLHEQNQNVSTRALETAEAAVKRDQIAFDAAQLRLVAGYGKAIVAQPDLPALIRALSAQEVALARIDLPLGEILSAPPLGGRLAAASANAVPFDAELLGPAPNTDPLAQGQGFLFLLKHASLPPGAALTGWLKLPGEAQAGVIVPREALLRHEGGVFVYAQTGDLTFERKEIELDRPLAAGWFVREGFKAGDKLVIVGAQQLLSEELRGRGGEE